MVAATASMKQCLRRRTFDDESVARLVTGGEREKKIEKIKLMKRNGVFLLNA